jgi:NTE family protein
VKKVGLALGSGGARGLGHIGVLLWLKEKGIEFQCISGSSIGSIIGAAIAAGYTPEHLRDIALGITWAKKVRNIKPSFRGKSIFEWQRIEEYLTELFGDKRIEDLKVPFACMATDIDTGREFVFKKGSVVKAISASSCIPGIFPPVEIEGAHLVDGGVVSPVPIDLASELGADLVIGVNVGRSVYSKRMVYESDLPSQTQRIDNWVRTVIEKSPLTRLGIIDGENLEEMILGRLRRRNIIDIITDSIAIVSSRVLSLQILEAGPHFLLRPAVGLYQDMDFEMAGEIIEKGYEEAVAAGDELMEFLGM